MSAIEFLSWDGGTDNDGSTATPRRPSIEDLGDDKYLDDTDFPPDPKEFPNAAAFKHLVRQVAAIARATAACKIEVRFSGTAPFVARIASPRSNLALSDFTVVDNGPGDTTVQWAAGTFPPSQCSPTGLTIFSNSASVSGQHVEELTNGIRVRTTLGGVATDLPWAIEFN